MSTKWHPDTCNCELEYDVIDEMTNNPIWTQTKCCERHATADECLEDNRNVNSIVNEVNNALPPEEHVQKHFDMKNNNLTLVYPGSTGVSTKELEVNQRVSSQVPRLARKVVN